ncbi:hypothetical protein, partial [Pedobacter sp.]|uniref:hypothetical protein n=1 Tax=Pedobacter sp. TaxID=1411316 RepID=UPI003D7F9AA1
LIGNHDFHYLYGIEDRYSRYQRSFAREISSVLESALDAMQMCYVYKDIVFNHAGITHSWSTHHQIDLKNLETSLNQKFLQDRDAFAFVHGLGDQSGNDKRQSPIWVRPEALLSDPIAGFHQVVGHTPQTKHLLQNGIAFIDVPGEVFTIENADTFNWLSN